jgi:hypothetical protein
MAAQSTVIFLTVGGGCNNESAQTRLITMSLKSPSADESSAPMLAEFAHRVNIFTVSCEY